MPRTQDDIDIDNLTPVVPSRLDPAQFEIVDSPVGRMERWRAASVTAGMIGPLYDVVQIIRNDAADATKRADAMEARKGLVQHLCDQIAGMQERINRLEDALSLRHKADAEREAREEQERQFAEEPLTLPPDIYEYQTRTPPAEIGDETHTPGGELHAVSPKEEPPFEDSDNVGDLPAALRDLPDPVPEPRGTVFPQPVSISLTEE